jgi:hypothetical protein
VSTVAFYSGEMMSPEAIRAAIPGARFIARAAVPAEPGSVPSEFAPIVTDTVWGIAVETGSEIGGEEVTATTDDGRRLRVVLAEPLLSGDPATVLANAQYWELPPAFANAMRAVIAPPQDEE